MQNVVYSIRMCFETQESKGPNHRETWEQRCRQIQDENKDEEGGKENFSYLVNIRHIIYLKRV